MILSEGLDLNHCNTAFLLIVRSGSSTSGGLRMGSGTVPTLTVDDAEAILNEIPSVEHVAPELPGVAQVVYGNQNWSTSITGTIPEMLEIRNWPVTLGRPFTSQDVNRATKVCLVDGRLWRISSGASIRPVRSFV